MILAKKTNTNLPDDFNASFWKETEPAYIPLGGQVLEKPRSYFPTVRNLTVRAAYNDKEIAFKIHWDDPSYDPALEAKNIVKPSPTPPLPEHLKGSQKGRAYRTRNTGFPGCSGPTIQLEQQGC